MKNCKICGEENELKKYKGGYICSKCISFIKVQTKNKKQ